MTPDDTIRIEKLSLQDPRYPESCQLREEVLMSPIGITFHEGIAAQDAESDHFAAFLEGVMVGVVLLSPTAQPGQSRLRQMAVRPDAQGMGVGRKLVESAEEWARRQAIREIRLHARVSAIGFYERLGYRLCGDVFMEVGLEHRLMTKELSDNTERSY